MDGDQARALAIRVYRDRKDLTGLPAIDHPRRVAEAVEESYKPTAWLHDCWEDGLLSWLDLNQVDLTNAQRVVILLLSRNSILYRTRTYVQYIERIATFPGTDGQEARADKLADLRDNITRPLPSMPNDVASVLDMRKPGGRYDRAIGTLEAA